MKIIKNKMSELEAREYGCMCPKCNMETADFYQLDKWEENDFLCGNCFVKELMESEADYQIIPKRELDVKG